MEFTAAHSEASGLSLVECYKRVWFDTAALRFVIEGASSRAGVAEELKAEIRRDVTNAQLAAKAAAKMKGKKR